MAGFGLGLDGEQGNSLGHAPDYSQAARQRLAQQTGQAAKARYAQDDSVLGTAGGALGAIIGAYVGGPAGAMQGWQWGQHGGKTVAAIGDGNPEANDRFVESMQAGKDWLGANKKNMQGWSQGGVGDEMAGAQQGLQQQEGLQSLADSAENIA